MSNNQDSEPLRIALSEPNGVEIDRFGNTALTGQVLVSRPLQEGEIGMVRTIVEEATGVLTRVPGERRRTFFGPPGRWGATWQPRGPKPNWSTGSDDDSARN